VTIYYDLKGKPTGEYKLDCSTGKCADGATCKKVEHPSADGKGTRVYCTCVKADGSEIPRDSCALELNVTKSPDDQVQLQLICCPKPCKEKKCEECQLVSDGKKKTTLDKDSDHPREVQEEEFRCECQPVNSKEVKAFYQDKICKLVTFAKKHGIEISQKDFFHAHVITDEGPPCRDDHGNWLMGEQFMLEHYLGLVGHAHEWDNGRSKTEDNFNIVINGDGEPFFAGSTTPYLPEHPTPDSIYFRLCDAGKECPDCTSKIHCGAIDADLCVGLRRRWPEKDPALGP
jgi:hypothetical protein